MAVKVALQMIRGTSAKNDNYTGKDGVLTIDKDRHELRIHDGSKKGGWPIRQQPVPTIKNSVNDITASDPDGYYWCKADPDAPLATVIEPIPLAYIDSLFA